MNTTIRIAPVRKSIVVAAGQARAFEVFTAGVDRWWPRDKTIGNGRAKTQVIEPRVGGRWYVTAEDDSKAVVGHVRIWQPPERFIVGWEINAQWKPDARMSWPRKSKSDSLPKALSEHASNSNIAISSAWAPAKARACAAMSTGDGPACWSALRSHWPAESANE